MKSNAVEILSEETIANYIASIFGQSEPGASIHHALIATCNPDQVTPLGLVDPESVKVHVYAIAPDQPGAADFVSQSLKGAFVELVEKRNFPIFAALAMEVYAVLDPPGDEEENKRRAVLHATDELSTHPKAVEVTMLYAACGDGRRWTGRHVLTGPTAGTINGPAVIVGRIRHHEEQPQPTIIRQIVGIDQVLREMFQIFTDGNGNEL